MSRYELSLSPDYVRDWSLTEAIRELFQNAIDQENISASNKMSYTYDVMEETLQIVSSNTLLDKSSLLLGNTSKHNDSTSIGQFGEGYKLALLVLAREGYDVNIYNNMREIWTPKFIYSKRYASELLVIDVKKDQHTRPYKKDLVFSIQGITEDDYHQIIETCLFMQDYKKIDTEDGEILLSTDHRSKVFVNGLFVCRCDDSEIKYGYNVKPKHIKLDRDRSMISTFDLTWMTSSLWSKHQDKDLVAKLIVDNISDVQYLDSMCCSQSISDAAFDEFTNKHGVTAVPVQESDNIQVLQKQYPLLKPVVVSNSTAKVIKKSDMYKQYLAHCEKDIIIRSPNDILQGFLDEYQAELSHSANADLLDIVNQSKGWI